MIVPKFSSIFKNTNIPKFKYISSIRYSTNFWHSIVLHRYVTIKPFMKILLHNTHIRKTLYNISYLPSQFECPSLPDITKWSFTNCKSLKRLMKYIASKKFAQKVPSIDWR